MHHRIAARGPRQRWRQRVTPTASIAIILLANATIAAADEVTLIGGDRINGRIIDQSEQHIVVEHAVLGRLELPVSNVEAIRLADDDPAAEARLAMIQEAADEAAEEADSWKGRFEFGAGLSAGVTDEQSAHVGVKVKRETDRNITKLDAFYYYSASDGDRTDNKFTAGVRHDWLVPDSRWFYFAKGRYDYDEFQSWEHRISAAGGVGYHLIDKDDFDLKLRAGLGAIREFGSMNEDIRPEALLGLDTEWEITERQAFEATVEVYPDLDDTGEFRAVSDAGWTVLIDNDMNMSLSVGLHHEYESQTDPGIEHNDLRLTAGLQFDF